MTLSARNWAWDLEKRPVGGQNWVDLKPGEKLTLLYLAEMENASHGIAYPSIKKIAERTGLSPRTIITHLDTLVTCGFISKGKARPSRNGKWLRNTYVLHVDDENRSRDPEWQREQG